MKTTQRLLILTIALVLLCAPAFPARGHAPDSGLPSPPVAGASAYTNPSSGFYLMIPAGWIAVGSANMDEIISSGLVSDELVVTIYSVSYILDGTPVVLLYKADVLSPPFTHIGVSYLGEVEKAITFEDLLDITRMAESYYLENEKNYPGYTVTTQAVVDQVSTWYPVGHFGGVFETDGNRLAVAHFYVADGAHLYEFGVFAEEDILSGVLDDFADLLDSFLPPKPEPEPGRPGHQ